MLSAIVYLLGLAVVLRVGMQRSVDSQWSSRIDIPLALGTGVFFAWSCLDLASAHAGSDPMLVKDLLTSAISTDFMDYCGGLGSMLMDNEAGWPAKRSRAAAWLPATLADSVGILEGLALGAVLSTMLIGSGLYLWAQALGGRESGLMAVLTAMAMGPLVLLSHMLSYYPEMIAAFVLAAAAAAWAIRVRSILTMTLAGLAIGIVLLIDVRGLLWALPLLGGTALAAVLCDWRQDTPTNERIWTRPLGLMMALFVPIVLSYQLGSWAFPEHTTSLELQTDLRPLFHKRGATGVAFLPPYELDSAYRWGRSSIWEIPQTLGFLLDQSQLQPPEGLAKQEGIGSAEQHIDPWMLAGGIGLLGAVTVVGWRSWRGWALFCSLFPFAVALRGMGMVDEMQPRILTHWMPGLAVLLGLGFTAVMRLPGPQGWIERYWRAPRWRLDWGTCAISVFGMLLLLSGVISSGWSPSAEWRMRWDQDELLVHNDLKSKGQNAGPEGQANQSSGDGYNASVYDACWSGISRDRSRGIEREINSHDDPLDVLVDVVGGVWQSIWWDGVPDLDGLPEDVRVHVEWRTDTIIVNFVGPSGSSKDSLLQQEIEAAPGVGDVRLCGGAHLIRAWAQPYRTGWEGLLLGVLMEQVGTTGVALDPAEAHIQPELDLWEQARGWDDVTESNLNPTDCQDSTGVLLQRTTSPLSDRLEEMDRLIIERSGARP